MIVKREKAEELKMRVLYYIVSFGRVILIQVVTCLFMPTSICSAVLHFVGTSQEVECFDYVSTFRAVKILRRSSTIEAAGGDAAEQLVDR